MKTNTNIFNIEIVNSKKKISDRSAQQLENGNVLIFYNEDYDERREGIDRNTNYILYYPVIKLLESIRTEFIFRKYFIDKKYKHLIYFNKKEKKYKNFKKEYLPKERDIKQQDLNIDIKSMIFDTGYFIDIKKMIIEEKLNRKYITAFEDDIEKNKLTNSNITPYTITFISNKSQKDRLMNINSSNDVFIFKKSMSEYEYQSEQNIIEEAKEQDDDSISIQEDNNTLVEKDNNNILSKQGIKVASKMIEEATNAFKGFLNNIKTQTFTTPEFKVNKHLLNLNNIRKETRIEEQEYKICGYEYKNNICKKIYCNEIGGLIYKDQAECILSENSYVFYNDIKYENIFSNNKAYLIHKEGKRQYINFPEKGEMYLGLNKQREIILKPRVSSKITGEASTKNISTPIKSFDSKLPQTKSLELKKTDDVSINNIQPMNITKQKIKEVENKELEIQKVSLKKNVIDQLLVDKQKQQLKKIVKNQKIDSKDKNITDDVSTQVCTKLDKMDKEIANKTPDLDFDINQNKKRVDIFLSNNKKRQNSDIFISARTPPDKIIEDLTENTEMINEISNDTNSSKKNIESNEGKISNQTTELYHNNLILRAETSSNKEIIARKIKVIKEKNEETEKEQNIEVSNKLDIEVSNKLNIESDQNKISVQNLIHMSKKTNNNTPTSHKIHSNSDIKEDEDSYDFSEDNKNIEDIKKEDIANNKNKISNQDSMLIDTQEKINEEEQLSYDFLEVDEGEVIITKFVSNNKIFINTKERELKKNNRYKENTYILKWRALKTSIQTALLYIKPLTNSVNILILDEIANIDIKDIDNCKALHAFFNDIVKFDADKGIKFIKERKVNELLNHYKGKNKNVNIEENIDIFKLLSNIYKYSIKKEEGMIKNFFSSMVNTLSGNSTKKEDNLIYNHYRLKEKDYQNICKKLKILIGLFCHVDVGEIGITTSRKTLGVNVFNTTQAKEAYIRYFIDMLIHNFDVLNSELKILVLFAASVFAKDNIKFQQNHINYEFYKGSKKTIDYSNIKFESKIQFIGLYTICQIITGILKKVLNIESTIDMKSHFLIFLQNIKTQEIKENIDIPKKKTDLLKNKIRTMLSLYSKINQDKKIGLADKIKYANETINIYKLFRSKNKDKQTESEKKLRNLIRQDLIDKTKELSEEEEEVLNLSTIVRIMKDLFGDIKMDESLTFPILNNNGLLFSKAGVKKIFSLCLDVFKEHSFFKENAFIQTFFNQGLNIFSFISDISNCDNLIHTFTNLIKNQIVDFSRDVNIATANLVLLPFCESMNKITNEILDKLYKPKQNVAIKGMSNSLSSLLFDSLKIVFSNFMAAEEFISFIDKKVFNILIEELLSLRFTNDNTLSDSNKIHISYLHKVIYIFCIDFAYKYNSLVNHEDLKNINILNFILTPLLKYIKPEEDNQLKECVKPAANPSLFLIIDQISGVNDNRKEIDNIINELDQEEIILNGNIIKYNLDLYEYL